MVYEIYQLKHEYHNSDFLFESYDGLKRNGLSIEQERYRKIYTYEHDTDDLEVIFQKFNIDIPNDYRGHSLSLSDVIVVDNEDAYYVNTIGFVHLDDTEWNFRKEI